ncbi:MAG: flagellar biosynthesis protein FlhB [FCB group bacterium]|nr:flagellar biosynthesis protein FlhB [FCB group bacterium]
MANKSAQEKTERATPRKLKQARDRGQVARSMELNSVAVISLGFVTIYLMGPLLYENISSLMRHSLTEATRMTFNPVMIRGLFANTIISYAKIAGPILLALAVLAYLINIAQVGVLFSAKTLEPKLDKFNLVKGLGRLVSKRSLAELVRDVIKTILIAIVAYKTISGWVPGFMELADQTVGVYVKTLGKLALLLAIKLSAVLFIIALFDIAFQRYDHASKLKMSKQEVKEEMKDTDGNPLIKSRLRQVQREMARQRMMSEIPKADVVVTNPTHIAVALKYDSETMAAPTVLAKGQRLIAEQIKRVARENRIPIVENKPLARSLFKLVDVGGVVPATLFRAVAEVLAHIYRLKNGSGVSRG